MPAEYLVIWEFHVFEVHRAAFESAYGPCGAWVRLFRRDPAFLATDLLRDDSSKNDSSRNGKNHNAINPDSTRYVTVDRWQSRQAYELFRQTHAAEYQEIDARCAEWTDREVCIGSYFAPPV